MKINKFRITSAKALGFELSLKKQICVVRGSHSELVLDMMRELTGDYDASGSPDAVDEGRFVIHADVEMDGKDYGVCYIRNAESAEDNRIGVNFADGSLEFSVSDTYEYDRKRTERNTDGSNVFDDSKLILSGLLSESDRRMLSFELFIESLPANDDRPIFVYGLFDRIDASVDTTDIINDLTGLGRQVFAAVCEGYPKHLLSHKNVQAVDIK